MPQSQDLLRLQRRRDHAPLTRSAFGMPNTIRMQAGRGAHRILGRAGVQSRSHPPSASEGQKKPFVVEWRGPARAPDPSRRKIMAEAARKQRDSVTSTGAGRSDAVRKVLDKAKAEGRTSLTAPEGKLVCDAYGIPVPKEGVANSAPEAAKLADGMGYPVVLKIVSPDILHKTEAGGVLVGLKSADEVSKGYDTILANAKKYKADAKIDGVQVQQMLK